MTNEMKKYIKFHEPFHYIVTTLPPTAFPESKIFSHRFLKDNLIALKDKIKITLKDKRSRLNPHFPFILYPIFVFIVLP